MCVCAEQIFISIIIITIMKGGDEEVWLYIRLLMYMYICTNTIHT